MKIEVQVIHDDICNTCPDFKPVRFSEYLKNDVIRCKHYELCRRIFGYTLAIVKDQYPRKDEEDTPELVHCRDCKHSYQGNYFRNYACRLFGDDDQGLPNLIESGDFFCGYGEKRES